MPTDLRDLIERAGGDTTIRPDLAAIRRRAVKIQRRRRARRATTALVATVATVTLLVTVLPHAGTSNPDITTSSQNPIRAIATFPLPKPNSDLTHIVQGPDGNLWFTTTNAQLGRITPTGHIIMFAIPDGAEAIGITSGPDGNIWFTDTLGDAGQIGRITVSAPNTVTEYPLAAGVDPGGITTGPDHNLWFSEMIEANPLNVTGRIARITPSGTITEFPNSAQPSSPDGITVGPDHNLWFNGFGGQIGRITTSGHTTLFSLSAAVRASGGGFAITLGPDQNLWFTEQRGVIGRITPAGQITEYPLPADSGATRDLTGITVGPDHNLWFGSTQGPIGRITTKGTITFYPLPGVSPAFPTPGPHNTLWVSERDQIVRITLGPTRH